MDKDVCQKVLTVQRRTLSAIAMLALAASPIVAQEQINSKQEQVAPKQANVAPRLETDAPVPPETTDLQSEFELKEILDVRRRLGLSPLRGSLLDGAEVQRGTATDFVRALKKLQLTAPLAKAFSVPEYRSPSDSASERSLATRLRRTSQMLDFQANEYEIDRQFEPARRLRRLAQRLRRDARLSEQPQTEQPHERQADQPGWQKKQLPPAKAETR